MSPHCAPEQSFPRGGKRVPASLTCSRGFSWLPAAPPTSVLLPPRLSPTPAGFHPRLTLLIWPSRLTRLLLFICTVNLQHSFDPMSWQWSGNKPLWLNEKLANCVPTSVQKGKTAVSHSQQSKILLCSPSHSPATRTQRQGNHFFLPKFLFLHAL